MAKAHRGVCNIIKYGLKPRQELDNIRPWQSGKTFLSSEEETAIKEFK